MSTGYTSAISEGISFENFVMRCARAMGACISMRDDPMDKEIPNKFKPSTHYYDALEEAKNKLEKLNTMSLDDAEIEAQLEFEKLVESNEKSIQLKDKLRYKYQTMLRKVTEWNPPTDEYDGLKEFMIDQITKSIDFDCNNKSYYHTNLRLSACDWLSQRINMIQDDINYYEKENQEEVERAKKRTMWIQQLRKSLV